MQAPSRKLSALSGSHIPSTVRSAKKVEIVLHPTSVSKEVAGVLLILAILGIILVGIYFLEAQTSFLMNLKLADKLLGT